MGVGWVLCLACLTLWLPGLGWSLDLLSCGGFLSCAYMVKMARQARQGCWRGRTLFQLPGPVHRSSDCTRPPSHPQVKLHTLSCQVLGKAFAARRCAYQSELTSELLWASAFSSTNWGGHLHLEGVKPTLTQLRQQSRLFSCRHWRRPGVFLAPSAGL